MLHSDFLPLARFGVSAISDRTRKGHRRLKIPELRLSGNRALLGIGFEARAITFAARSACRANADFRENPKFNLISPWTDRHDQAMQVVLDHKGGFSGGIVVGALTRQEQVEWVGRLSGHLRVPCGQIVFPGGLVSVPRGNYSVEVLCYLNSETAGHIIDQWHAGIERTGGQELRQHPFCQREALGAYFRRTRPGQAFPQWLIKACCDDPHEDPGHEAEWVQRRQSNHTQSTEDVAHQESFVELIIQLRPIEQLPPAIPPQPGWPWHLRKPAQCPLGISCHEFLPHCSDS